MVIFFPLSATSAVPGGLGRLLLSSGGCWASASDATASRTSGTPTAKYPRCIICVSFREKPRYHRPGSSAKWPGTGGRLPAHVLEGVTKVQSAALYQVLLFIIPHVT